MRYNDFPGHNQRVSVIGGCALLINKALWYTVINDSINSAIMCVQVIGNSTV